MAHPLRQHPPRAPWLLTALLVASLTSADLTSWSRERAPDESREGRTPKILLSASPAFGFAPLSVQLVATMTGVDSTDANFCHAGVTWIRIDPGSAPETGARLSEDPKCVHPGDKMFVATTFSKTFDLSLPGSYLYRIVVDGKDGRQVKSNFVKVRVLRVP